MSYLKIGTNSFEGEITDHDSHGQMALMAMGQQFLVTALKTLHGQIGAAVQAGDPKIGRDIVDQNSPFHLYCAKALIGDVHDFEREFHLKHQNDSLKRFKIDIFIASQGTSQ